MSLSLQNRFWPTFKKRLAAQKTIEAKKTAFPRLSVVPLQPNLAKPPHQNITTTTLPTGFRTTTSSYSSSDLPTAKVSCHSKHPNPSYSSSNSTKSSSKSTESFLQNYNLACSSFLLHSKHPFALVPIVVAFINAAFRENFSQTEMSELIDQILFDFIKCQPNAPPCQEPFQDLHARVALEILLGYVSSFPQITWDKQSFEMGSTGLKWNNPRFRLLESQLKQLDHCKIYESALCNNAFLDSRTKGSIWKALEKKSVETGFNINPNLVFEFKKDRVDRYDIFTNCKSLKSSLALIAEASKDRLHSTIRLLGNRGHLTSPLIQLGILDVFMKESDLTKRFQFSLNIIFQLISRNLNPSQELINMIAQRFSSLSGFKYPVFSLFIAWVANTSIPAHRKTICAFLNNVSSKEDLKLTSQIWEIVGKADYISPKILNKLIVACGKSKDVFTLNEIFEYLKTSNLKMSAAMEFKLYSNMICSAGISETPSLILQIFSHTRIKTKDMLKKVFQYLDNSNNVPHNFFYDLIAAIVNHGITDCDWIFSALQSSSSRVARHLKKEHIEEIVASLLEKSSKDNVVVLKDIQQLDIAMKSQI